LDRINIGALIGFLLVFTLIIGFVLIFPMVLLVNRFQIGENVVPNEIVYIADETRYPYQEIPAEEPHTIENLPEEAPTIADPVDPLPLEALPLITEDPVEAPILTVEDPIEALHLGEPPFIMGHPVELPPLISPVFELVPPSPMSTLMSRFGRNLLMNTLTIVIAVIAIFILILIRLAWKHYMNNLKGKKTLVNDDAESIEAEWMVDFGAFKLPQFFARGPEDKTRRLFWKTVRRHMKRGVRITPSDTPEEMAERIKSKDIDSLLENYEQVRYGRDG